TVGMAPLDVLAAGSWKARTWLGLPGIEEGGLADLVVYDTDPRHDLGVLTAPRRIVLRGRVVR
ncbi:MAG TPA: amidohydrolase family protein, partial [Cryptosporangiaceae bacterium]|nr:amidohydrolase family protein [Cryptosporangiaceae bacterium]